MTAGGMTSIIKGGATPVFQAALNGHLDVVKYLVLEANADPNKGDKVWSRAWCAWDLFERVPVCVIWWVHPRVC